MLTRHCNKCGDIKIEPDHLPYAAYSVKITKECKEFESGAYVEVFVACPHCDTPFIEWFDDRYRDEEHAQTNWENDYFEYLEKL